MPTRPSSTPSAFVTEPSAVLVYSRPTPSRTGPPPATRGQTAEGDRSTSFQLLRRVKREVHNHSLPARNAGHRSMTPSVVFFLDDRAQLVRDQRKTPPHWRIRVVIAAMPSLTRSA
jgi:hypothetical protein